MQFRRNFLSLLLVAASASAIQVPRFAPRGAARFGAASYDRDTSFFPLAREAASDMFTDGLTTAKAAAAKVTLSFQEKMIAGATARGISQTVLHPIDVARTRLQAKGVKKDWSPKVFLKGVLPQIILAVPAGAFQFVGFEYCKEALPKVLPGDGLSDVRSLLAGAGGAMAASVIRVPQEVLKQRIQADMYPNLAVAFSSIAKNDGIKGFYKGYTATISRDVPWNAMAFLFHAQFKRIFSAVSGRPCTDQENLALASAGGMLSAVIMTPIDVCKTRIMTGTGGEYINLPQTFVKVLGEEGPMTLMKGVVPRVMYLAPLAGVTLSIYDSLSARIIAKKTAALKGKR
jgi:solute carrier family 25 S-adenosylmethionine transporter 26